MKTVVIGTGTLGRPIIDLLKQKGHEVIAASRSTEPAVDLSDPDSIKQFCSEVGEVDAIVCAAGNASFGALDDLSDEDFQLSLNSKLMGQVNLLREGRKHLSSNGVIVLTGGMLAYAPWPETSAVAMVNAGVEGFVKGAAQDLPDGQRAAIVHPPFLRETADAMGMETKPWPAAAEAAKVYLEVLEGDVSGRPVFVPGYLPTQ